MFHKEVKNRGFKMCFSSVVIAGGKSSRLMGMNKALLKIGGLTIIEKECFTLRSIFDEIIIVSNRPDEFKVLDPEFKVYSDEAESRGPLAGIYTGLLKMKNEAGFFCACDMPFLNGELIKFMLSQNKGFDIVCPCTGGKYVEPLHAVYAKTCIEPIKSLMKKNEPVRVQDLFSMVKTRFIDVGSVPCKMHDYDFFNINTWESYMEAIRINETLV
ncbi:MAG TPA: molybdenum cofactor guanylyltransferase [Thermoanaerobacterales bacterium]|nr:molybdenum cofactor guanylyltransferase [Thermoanaerobacterales bacterium]